MEYDQCFKDVGEEQEMDSGFDFKLTDTITFTPEYVCQAYHNRRGYYSRRTYDDHVMYMTLTIKL